MKYGQIPGIAKQVSRLIQGTTMVGSSNAEKSFELLDAVFESGCNTFDTAHGYGGGDNERFVGRWINERGIRDKVIILGKGAHHNDDRRRVTPYDIKSDIHDSLARFKTDYIDLYVLHRDDPSVPVGPIVEVLNELKTEGLIHAFGGSNWTSARLDEANAYANDHGLTPFAVSSPNFSLAEQIAEPWWECVTLTGEAGKTERDWYRQTQFPLLAWSSLAGGFFSGAYTRANLADRDTNMCMGSYGSEANFDRYDRCAKLAAEKGLSVAQVALAWVLNQPMNVFPLVGGATPDEVKSNCDALDVTLTPDQLAWLNLEQ